MFDIYDLTTVALREWWRGKGIPRTLMNRQIAQSVRLHGHVLDAGGGGRPSYWRFISSHASADVTNVLLVLDLDIERKPDVCGLVESIPLRDDSFDTVLCFNLLEHVFDFRSALSEMRRVLKIGGCLYGYVPFLAGIHADPYDYWRYTRWSLEHVLGEAGYKDIRIVPHGGYFLALGALAAPMVRRLHLLHFLWCIVTTACDRLFNRLIARGKYREKYILGYFFEAR